MIRNILKVKSRFSSQATSSFQIPSSFEVQKIENLDDFKIKVYQLKHKKTNLRYVHLQNEDENNAMSIIFKTLPTNSRGVPHVLEHMVCCGSQKYQVRDPFFKMLKRSLSTYMNAWTGGDFTSYVFSSKNQKDFINLREVYMDLSFKALLRHNDFLQEGWRYIEDEKTKELQYAGVVFNEMKGVYQSGDSVFQERISQEIYKGTTYQHSSGGEPAHITDMTYQELKDFHQKYYHPSNSIVYSYGNADLTSHLKFIEENYLQNATPLPEKIEVNLADKIENIKTIEFTGPVDSVRSDKEIKYCQAYLCNDVKQGVLETYGLSLISSLLFDSPNGHFYKRLIESGLAPNYSPGNGYIDSIHHIYHTLHTKYTYDSFCRQGLFTIGVSNVGENDIHQVQKVIQDTLQQVANEGFPNDLVESYLHQIELGAKKPSSNFGINVLMHIFSQMNHTDNPVENLKVSSYLQELRQKI